MSIVIHFKILVENSHDRIFTHFISLFAFGYRILSLNYLELHVHVNFHLDDPMISIAACFFLRKRFCLWKLKTNLSYLLSFIYKYILWSRNLMVNCFCNICRRQEEFVLDLSKPNTKVEKITEMTKNCRLIKDNQMVTKFTSK